MKQSSISRAIRQLEDELGVPLFERRSTGAYLTDARRSLLREARSALEQLDLAEKTAAAAGRAEIGIVRVEILTSLAGGFLRELVRCYAHRHPEITIDIRDGGAPLAPAFHHAGFLPIKLTTPMPCGNSSRPWAPK